MALDQSSRSAEQQRLMSNGTHCNAMWRGGGADGGPNRTGWNAGLSSPAHCSCWRSPVRRPGSGRATTLCLALPSLLPPLPAAVATSARASDPFCIPRGTQRQALAIPPGQARPGPLTRKVIHCSLLLPVTESYSNISRVVRGGEEENPSCVPPGPSRVPSRPPRSLNSLAGVGVVCCGSAALPQQKQNLVAVRRDAQRPPARPTD